MEKATTNAKTIVNGDAFRVNISGDIAMHNVQNTIIKAMDIPYAANTLFSWLLGLNTFSKSPTKSLWLSEKTFASTKLFFLIEL